MEHKSLSLTKKLDGGYLHVKKHKEQQKQRSKGGGYSNYLKRVSGKDKSGGHTLTNMKGGYQNDTQSKVVAIKLGGSPKKKKKSPKKNKPHVKDISTTPIIPKKVEPKPKKVEPKPKKVEPKPKKVEPKPKKSVPVQLPKTKGSLKKGTVVRRSRSRGRSRGRSLTRRRCHDPKKGKRISVTKVRKLSKKDVNNIQSKIKDIKKKSTADIKKELDKQGIQVSGKSPEILKDIYMYSQLCGINIKRE